MAGTRKTPRIYTPEERLAFVTDIDRQLRAGGGSGQALAAAVGTSDTNYYNWRKAGIKPTVAPEAAPPAPVPAARLYNPDERKRLMNEVERLRGQGHSIVAACRVLGLSDKSFRKWKARHGVLHREAPLDRRRPPCAPRRRSSNCRVHWQIAAEWRRSRPRRPPWRGAARARHRFGHSRGSV